MSNNYDDDIHIHQYYQPNTYTILWSDCQVLARWIVIAYGIILLAQYIKTINNFKIQCKMEKTDQISHVQEIPQDRELMECSKNPTFQSDDTLENKVSKIANNVNEICPGLSKKIYPLYPRFLDMDTSSLVIFKFDFAFFWKRIKFQSGSTQPILDLRVGVNQINSFQITRIYMVDFRTKWS